MNLISFFISLLFFFSQFVSISSTVHFFTEIAKQALADEEEYGNLKKGYQYLAERALEKLHAFYPSTLHRFMVMVIRNETSGEWEGISRNIEQFEYNDINVVIYSTYATNFFIGNKECVRKLDIKIQNCNESEPAKIFRKMEGICVGHGNHSLLHFTIKAVMPDADLGVASSLFSNAFNDAILKCPSKKTGNKLRVVMALSQNFEAALDLKTRNKSWYTRLKSRITGKYLTIKKDGGKYSLVAMEQKNDNINIWQFFRFFDDPVDDSIIYIFAYAIREFIGVDKVTGKLFVDLNDTADVWRQFSVNWLQNQDAVTIKSIGNGKYVSMNLNNATGSLVANKVAPEVTEIFDAVLPEDWGDIEKNCAEGQNNTAANSGKRWYIPVYIFLGIMTVFLSLLISMSILICYFCKSRQFRGSFSFQLHAFWYLHIRNKLDRMLDSTAIDIERSIYSGPNSRVYFGRYFIGGQMREVAVKVPSKEAFNVSMIIEETRINANLRHKRIVEYIGFYEDACKNMRIVSEFMEGGDLHSFLTNHKNHLTIGHLFNFFNQIVEGMEYLASKKIIHRDLAARNCMLTGDYSSIKIADFGLSRHFNVDANYACSSPVRLPLRWTAIECLGQNAEILPNSKFSEKSDVWSFGIVCWECFTRGEMPYGAVDVKDVVGELRDGWRLDRPENCPQQFYDQLMLKCWDGKHEARPTFAMLKLMLGDIFDWLLAYEPDLIMK